MSQETAFHEAVQAMSQGQRERARDLFTRLLKRDSSNPEYWLWMSAVVDTTPERIYCLQNVIQLDPNNQAAQRGLILMGARQADDTLPPAPVIKRKWAVTLPAKASHRPIIKRLISNRYVQVVGILAALVFAISLIYSGLKAPIAESSPTTTFIVVAITVNPTLTPTASSTPERTITPILSGATPLKAYLKATYTPIPAYVNTPHPILEAFTIAIRSYERGDYARMVSYLEQAYREEPQSPDIIYLLGEGYRKMGDRERALELFEKAIDLNEYFAPPYLGRALLNLETNPGRYISTDLEKAIQLDPYYVDAYMALAEYQLDQNNLEAADQALEDLSVILSYEDARFYWLKARILLAQAEYPAALDAAQYSIHLDQTMLPAYLTLAQAYLANSEYESAIETVKVFLRYEPKYPLAWLILAQAQYLSNADQTSTLKSLDKAIELNPDNPEVYWYHGLIMLDDGENQAAVNDLLQAVHLDGSSFDYNLDFGRALYASERYTDAYRQLNGAERLANEDTQKAAVYYWRARTLEAAENFTQARAEWKRLLGLPADALPDGWLKYAQEHLNALETSTPTATSTPSAIVSVTQTPTKTLLP